MSSTLRTYIGLAIVASRAMTATTTTERRCPNGHEVRSQSHRFCPTCGEEIVFVDVITPETVSITKLIDISHNDYTDWLEWVNEATAEQDGLDILIDTGGGFGIEMDDTYTDLDVGSYGSAEMIAEFEEMYAILLDEMRQVLPSVEVKFIATAWWY